MHLQFILSVAKNVLKEWNLNINTSKTEFVEFYLAQSGDSDANEEPWRKTKLLGSCLCSTYDIHMRCIAGNVAFNNYKNVWLQGRQISIGRRIQVYEAMVVSVIMYNCSSWTATKEVLKELDVCHRNHLRQILKIHYPNKISNEKLYDICSTKPLSERVKIARWKMLGHILRSPVNSPAALALSFAVEKSTELKGRRGRPQNNLLTTIRNDISRIHLSDNQHLQQRVCLKKSSDLELLRLVASNREDWRKLFNYVV